MNEPSKTLTILPERPPKKHRSLSYTAAALAMCMLCGISGYTGAKLAGGNASANATNSPVTQLAAGTNGNATESNAASVASIASPSVVEISTEAKVTGRQMQEYVSEGAGSGIITSADGYIVTNNHVISGASKITVTLSNGQSYQASLIGTDSQTDIALLKIEASGLAPATFADSDQIAVGEEAIAIGNPLGNLGGTVTNGIISALNREITIDGQTMNLLQTNAAVNPGNSGGGLFNASGQLIGMVIAKSSGSDVEGLGFAIPANDVKQVAAQLAEHGYVKGRVALGVSLVDVTSQQAQLTYRTSTPGIYVLKVTENSAAQKAGIQSGDCIASIDGQSVTALSDITSALKEKNVGDTVSITVNRQNQSLNLNVTLQESVPE